MAGTDWDVSKGQRTCGLTGRLFEQGETYYSALVETENGFDRHDYSEEAWERLEAEKKAAFFSFWKTKVLPQDAKNKRLVIDVDAFYGFFTNLSGAQDEKKTIFRYLVALLLVRKRILRLDRIETRGDGTECLFLYDNRAKADLELPTPNHTQEQLAETQETLNRIFECGTSITDL